jgi:hypothetical protein
VTTQADTKTNPLLRRIAAFALVPLAIVPLNILAIVSDISTPLHLLWLVGVPMAVAGLLFRTIGTRIIGAALLTLWAFCVLVVSNIVLFGSSV